MACPPRDAFQIGWICALLVEAAAAAEMLDENFGILEEQDVADSNIYTLGRIGKHNICIACLPGGQYGTTSATTVANNMLRTFSKSLRLGLMVGIGGGIPSADHDIRLGDVVISYPQGTYGGVVQYDKGKVTAGGGFERAGSLNSPPRALLTAVSMLRAAALRDNPRYLQYLQSAIGRTEQTRKNFGRPAAQCDRLFQAKRDHPVNASSCDGCPAEWEETRSKREDSNPQPHYGNIASGNCVIKHGETREQIRVTTGALCFDMEAAGLMLDFPCIVIRGICDYADSHKNKRWQGYAALAAASYTKELLGYVPIGLVSQERLVVDICTELKEEIQGTNQRLDEIKAQQDQHHRERIEFRVTEEQRSCHQSFKVTNYEEQKNINPRRVEGTCRWALQSPEYIRWSESTRSDLLLVSADPGCGKSVLARSIIDNYLEAPSQAVIVCYFFFKDNEEQNHLSAAMCSVLHQLFSQRPELLQYAIPSWEKHGVTLQQETEELWRIFISATSAIASYRTICIFDALDECRETDQGRLIEKLQSFHRQQCLSTRGACLKFLITSRPYDHIQNRFRVTTDSFPHLHLKGEEENKKIHEEINSVVKIRVEELAKTVPLSLDIQQRLEQQLLQMEHRTYLWLHLAMDDIQCMFENSFQPAEESIRMIPDSVNKAYEKILHRVHSSQVNTVRIILQIIVGARRPLTTAEMAIALGIAIRPQSRTIAQAGLDPLQMHKKLRRLCGLFVFINDSKIYLIHQTAREFLIEKASLNDVDFAYSCSLSDTADLMAHICMQYLLMEDLEHGEDESCSNIRSFLEYSAVHWPDHVRNMALTSKKEVIDWLHRLYDMGGNLFSLWFSIFWRAMRPNDRIPTMKPLHLAAFNGHMQVLHQLLATDKDNINLKDSTGSTAVMWASLNGHQDAVQLILSHGANVNTEGGEYGNALLAASVKGYDKIVQMLIEYGADVNFYGGVCCNALFAAYCGGHYSTMRILLKHGADVNVRCQYYGNTIQAICGAGDVETMRMLLEHGASLVCQGDEQFANVLYVACWEGRTNIAHILLQYGAKVNAQIDSYCTSFLFDWYNAEEYVQVDTYDSSLVAACANGHDKIVQMLLEHGANVNTQDGFYGTALQVACYGGHNKVVEMLLEHGADVNTQGGYYGTAIQAACSRGHDKIVETLHGVRCGT
ncbi:purine and uridine phosphorylase [Aspergillus caelatus]|uniref:Purine and uridine phosphorylase n=1 Tax=Aspergillus caelatus TaxID=61420 RepID=A0A5N7A1T4_9EURO|nr:purine and uridine phosphorylase [Aspergillus caelatus]KAE8363146.1 purine and uridine phosphorylase [Aspergillus caelatus]